MQVVGGAQGEVGHELEVHDAVGADLQVADWEAVVRFAAEGAEVDGLDAARDADAFFCELVGGGGCGEAEGGGVEGRCFFVEFVFLGLCGFHEAGSWSIVSGFNGGVLFQAYDDCFLGTVAGGCAGGVGLEK